MILALDLPTPLPPERAIVAEARAVSDTAALRMEEYRSGDRPSWVIVRVTPDSSSGSLVIPGLTINGRTGETQAPPPGTAAQTVVSGTWQDLEPAPTSAPGTGHYSWSIPLIEEKRGTPPDDIYSPFIHGGTVLARPAGTGQGIAPFTSVRLIFGPWAGYVAREARGLPGAAVGVAGLTGANPLKAVVSLRGMLAARTARPSDIADALRPTGAERRAVVTFLTLMTANNTLLAPVRDAIRAGTSTPDVSPFVIGVFAAALFSNDSQVQSRAVELARLSSERLAQLSAHVDPASEIGLIYAKLGLPP